MGLFGIKRSSAESVNTEQFEPIKTANFQDESNDHLLEMVERCAANVYGDSKESYYVIKNFLINICGQEMADFWLPKNDKFDIQHAKELINLWTIDEAIKPDNVFRIFMASPSSKKLFLDIHGGNPISICITDRVFRDIYNWYCYEVIDNDTVTDSESVLYQKGLYALEDEDRIKLLNIDKNLSNDKEQRKAIIYNSEGQIRRLSRIEEDYNHYKECGNVSKEIQF